MPHSSRRELGEVVEDGVSLTRVMRGDVVFQLLPPLDFGTERRDLFRLQLFDLPLERAPLRIRLGEPLPPVRVCVVRMLRMASTESVGSGADRPVDFDGEISRPPEPLRPIPVNRVQPLDRIDGGFTSGLSASRFDPRAVGEQDDARPVDLDSLGSRGWLRSSACFQSWVSGGPGSWSRRTWSGPEFRT